MSPFYTLVNKSSFELEVGEVQNNNGFSCKWHYISSTEVSAELVFYQGQKYSHSKFVECMIVCVTVFAFLAWGQYREALCTSCGIWI